jgi:hypothetical protein
MQIAYVAYKHLDASVKDKVDALLKLNADYSKWTAGAPDEKTAKLYAFVQPRPGRMTSRERSTDTRGTM